MKFETMQAEIMAKWSEHFNGKCDVEICRMCGRFIWIEMRLSEKIDVCKQNDIFQIRFMIGEAVPPKLIESVCMNIKEVNEK